MNISFLEAQIKASSTNKLAIFNRKLLRLSNNHSEIVLGCNLPNLRKIAKNFGKRLDILDISELLRSRFHESKILALIIMIDRSKSADNIIRKNIVNLYLNNIKHINNWDLVDMSAHKIIGQYYHPQDDIFNKLSHAKNIWENRIAIVATWSFIKKKNYSLTLKLAKQFFKHNHHLIHRSTGWMLREIGKQDINILLNFLAEYHNDMPSSMLRYACERLSYEQKKLFK